MNLSQEGTGRVREGKHPGVEIVLDEGLHSEGGQVAGRLSRWPVAEGLEVA